MQRMKWQFFLALQVFQLLFVGCHKRASTIASAQLTEQQVSSLVVTGASQNLVNSAFGRPVSKSRLSDGSWSAFYSFPDRDRPSNYTNLMVGIEVYYRDGRVIRWTPVYGERYTTGGPVSTDTVARPSTGANFHLPVVLWVLHETSFPGSVEVSTPPLTEKAYVHRQPDLMLWSFGPPEAVSERAGSKAIPALNLTLGDTQESQDLKAFTETNTGNRILFLVGTNAVSAGRLLEPIDNGTLTLTFPDQAFYTKALDLLSRGSTDKK